MRFPTHLRLLCDLGYAEHHLQPRHKYSRCDVLAPPSFNSIPKFEILDSAALCGLQISKGNTNPPVCAAHGRLTISVIIHRTYSYSQTPQRVLACCSSVSMKIIITTLFWVITQREVVTFLTKFRDNLSGPSSGFKNPKKYKKIK